MTWDSKVGKQEQDQRTYENNAEARRVTLIDKTGDNVDSSNPLPVTPVGGSADTPYRDKGTALVTFGTEATLISYTVPSANKFVLTGLNVSGEADGDFVVYINSVAEMTIKLSPSERSKYVTINDNNFELAGDDVIEIKVTNVSHRQNAANYNSTMIGGIV